MHVNN